MEENTPVESAAPEVADTAIDANDALSIFDDAESGIEDPAPPADMQSLYTDQGEEAEQNPEGETANEGEVEEAPEVEAEAETEADPDLKTYTFKDGENEYQLSENAEIEVKFDGQMETATLEELKKSWNGKKYYEREITEVDRARKAVAKEQEDIAQVDGELKAISQLAIDGNPYAALDRLFKMAGGDRTELFKNFIAQSVKTVEEMKGLNQQQIQALMQQKEMAHREEMLKEREEKWNTKSQNEQVNSYVQQIQQEHSISDDEMKEALDDLQEVGTSFEGWEVQKIADSLKEYIVDYKRPYSVVKEAVGEVDPSLSGDSNFLQEIFSLTEGFSKDDIKDVVREYLGKTNEPKASPSKDSEKEAPPQATPERAPRKEDQAAANELVFTTMDDLLGQYD